METRTWCSDEVITVQKFCNAIYTMFSETVAMYHVSRW